ncbi:MAG: Hpt domain-containing protein [Oligoflexia bacterium]|nr:Hpt domain-containing protein [Oligoflexia bacterium]
MSFNINKDLQASHSIITLLEKAKNFSEITIDSLPIVFAVINQEGVILRANRCLAQLFRKDCEQILRDNFSSIFEKETWEIFRNNFNKIIECDHKFVEFELDISDGEAKGTIKESYYWYVTRFGSFEQSEGNTYVILGQNISKLRESEKQLAEIFNSISLAILTIDSNKKIMPRYSAFAECIFKTSEIGGNNFKDFIFASGMRLLLKDAQDAINGLENIFGESELMYEVIKDKLPKQIYYKTCGKNGNTEELYLGLSYQPIIYDGIVKRILLIVEDRTSIVKAEEENKKIKILDDQVVRRVVQVRSAKPEMMEILIHEVDKLFSRSKEHLQSKSWRNFANTMHSIKGNARVVGLFTLANLAHQTEDLLLISIEDQLNDYEKIRENFILMDKEWEEIKILFQALKSDSSNKSNSANKIANIGEIQELFAQYNKCILEGQIVETAIISEKINIKLQKILSVELPSIKQLILERAEQTAKKLNKTVNVDFHCPLIKVNDDIKDVVNEALLHLINNSLAHGIEDEPQRIEKGKTPTGNVCIVIKEDKDILHIEFNDDGAGINIAKIRNKIVKQNLLKLEEAATLHDDKLIQFIFMPGFSTADEVDEIKGRGIGLDAVLSRIKAYEGTINVKTAADKGSTFIIEIPLIKKKEVVKKLYSVRNFVTNLIDLLKVMEKEDNISIDYKNLLAESTNGTGIIFIDRTKLLLALTNHIGIVGQCYKKVQLNFRKNDSGLVSLILSYKDISDKSQAELKYSVPIDICNHYILNHGGRVVETRERTEIIFGFYLSKDLIPLITYSYSKDLSNSEIENLAQFINQVMDEFDIRISVEKNETTAGIHFVKHLQDSRVSNHCLFTVNHTEFKRSIFDHLRRLICL